MAQWNPQANDIFLGAVEIAPTGERVAYLAQACGENAELRAQVEALLAASAKVGSFLEHPADPYATGAFAPASVGEDLRIVPTQENVGDQVGPYKLLQKLGEGGMGTVWVAEQQQPVKRRVAVKVIKAGMDSAQVLRRFEAERQALALMDHTNIAKVLDVGKTASGRPYFAMELVPGVPIQRYCDELHLTVRERLELFLPVCRAIQHAHQKGIIHRDIKPSNVLVSMQDGKPVAKVIDFGVAKALSQQLTERTMYTEIGAVIGTLEYMAPEQAEMSPLGVDTRSDIYSLGVLLYELLTGTTPLDKKRLRSAAFAEMLRMIKEEEPPRPSTRLTESKESLASLAVQRRTEPARLTKEVRGELDWIVMKCLEKDRTRRYETANGLARDLERHLHDEPVEACPPSARYRLGKFVRRHKGPVLAASLILLALLVGIVGTTWGLIEADKERRVAQAAQRAEAERAEGEKQAKQEALNAAAAEKKANEQAQKRLRQIEKGNEIMSAVFADLDPRAEEKTGKQLRVILGERLTKAAEQLEGEAVGDPLVVARLQHRLGQSLLSLGMAEQAIVLFAKARQTFVTNLGTDHSDTLTSMSNLAEGYRTAGQLDQALPLLERTFKVMKAKLGSDHPNTLTTMNNLAVGYQATGKLDQALPLWEESLKVMKAKLGPNHPDTLNTMSNLGSAYQAAGQLDQALPLLEEALKVRKAKLGADHPDTLSSMNAMAAGYHAAGKPALALPLLEETVKVRKAKLGADHPDTLTSMDNLAEGYQDAGKLDWALVLREETLKVMKAKLGTDHPDTLISMNNLAMGYQAADKLDRALPLFQEAVAGIEKRRFQHAYADRIVNNLIGCHEKLKHFDQAEAWRRKWLAVVKERSGADSPPYAGELAALGLTLLHQKKWTDAKAVLRESLAIREKTQPDDWRTFNTKSLLGGALLGQKKYADAEPLLLAGYEGMKRRMDKIPPQGKVRLTEALERLVQLYEATGKKDESANWRQELERNTKIRKTSGMP